MASAECHMSCLQVPGGGIARGSAIEDIPLSFSYLVLNMLVTVVLEILIVGIPDDRFLGFLIVDS